MDLIELLRKQISELDFRVSAIEHLIRTNGVPAGDEKSIIDGITEAKNTILKTASSALLKASKAIGPNEAA